MKSKKSGPKGGFCVLSFESSSFGPLARTVYAIVISLHVCGFFPIVVAAVCWGRLRRMWSLLMNPSKHSTETDYMVTRLDD